MERPEYMIQIDRYSADSGAVKLLTGKTQVGEAYLRNGYSKVTGMKFRTSAYYDQEGKQPDRDMTEVMVYNSKGDLTNGFMRVDTKMFNQLCIAYLETQGYITHKPSSKDAKDYIAYDGKCCPVCEETDTEGMHAGDINDGIYRQGVTCNNCGAEWQDVYSLIDMVGLETDDE